MVRVGEVLRNLIPQKKVESGKKHERNGFFIARRD